MKLNYTQKVLVFVENDNVLDRRLEAIKKNIYALSLDSKGAGLDVNIDITKYMIMPRVQNAGQNQNIWLIDR